MAVAVEAAAVARRAVTVDTEEKAVTGLGPARPQPSSPLATRGGLLAATERRQFSVSGRGRGRGPGKGVEVAGRRGDKLYRVIFFCFVFVHVRATL